MMAVMTGRAGCFMLVAGAMLLMSSSALAQRPGDPLNGLEKLKDFRAGRASARNFLNPQIVTA